MNYSCVVPHDDVPCVCWLVTGPRKNREACRHFGRAPGVPNSHTKYVWPRCLLNLLSHMLMGYSEIAVHVAGQVTLFGDLQSDVVECLLFTICFNYAIM